MLVEVMEFQLSDFKSGRYCCEIAALNVPENLENLGVATGMEKSRDFFKKIRDIKGTFHAKMGTIKDRAGMHLTEAEDVKKRWQEYTEELYRKDLLSPENLTMV